MADVRWRPWLRAFHRDFGYLAIGFTVIYAVSGLAQNHIEDWGDVSYRETDRTIAIPAIPEDAPDDVKVQRVADAVKLGAPTSQLVAGDEIRLEFANGSKAIAIGVAPSATPIGSMRRGGTEITVQVRERRAFIGIANWLHKARGKKAWTYVSDAYAVLLLYLALSGIFMIKGRLGLRWRGAVMITAGVAVPVLYVLIAGGPGSQQTRNPDVTTAAAPIPNSGMRALPPDDDAH